MGTNYYVASDLSQRIAAVKESGTPDEMRTMIDELRGLLAMGGGFSRLLHIGKSSMGWCFSLHGIPELGLNDWPEWKEYLKGKSIEDEYDQTVTLEELCDIVENRNYAPSRGADNWSPQQYRANYAEPGPNGLVRHSLSEGHCVKHGAGTWDVILGEFS